MITKELKTKYSNKRRLESINSFLDMHLSFEDVGKSLLILLMAKQRHQERHQRFLNETKKDFKGMKIKTWNSRPRIFERI